MSNPQGPFLDRLKRSLGEARRFASWLRYDLRDHPRLALYARGQNRINQRFFARIKEAEEAGTAPHLAVHAPADPVPKTLWMYWAQGEAAAPPVVRHCVASWRRLNPDWDVRVLDAETVSDLVDLSDVPDVLPRRYTANMLRLRLLKQHGGVWADATVLCHRPLDDWLPLHAMTGFFVFSDPGPDRWLTSWFIAATPGHSLTIAWEEAYTALVTALRRKPVPYFVLHYSFQNRVRSDPDLLAAWQRCACLPATPTLLLMAALEDKLPLHAASDAIRCGLPMSKLSWKSAVEPARMEQALRDITQTRS